QDGRPKKNLRAVRLRRASISRRIESPSRETNAMSSAQVGAVLQQIRKLADVRHDDEAADHQLLERFARHQDEDAFAALLRRHGPMVLRVCQSVLHELHDAEDAFQAAFLLLAQKAGSIHRREAVSAWLYRVAYHLAIRAGANAARRRVVEKRAVTMPS